MSFSGGINGTHRIITLAVPGRAQALVLCLVQSDSAGADSYYVLAECEGRYTRWRSMVKDNAVHRLKDEFVPFITNQEEIDDFDVESIFFCTTEVSKKA